VLKLKTPWRDGTTHLVTSRLEFMQRLAALVPGPRLHLIRFHGVLAPNAELRAQVVPQEPEPPAQAAPPAECEATCAHHRPVRLSWAKLLKRVFEIDMAHCRVWRPGRRRARQPVVRNCKRPETRQPTRFRRPGAQGHGNRLCQGFSEPRFGG